MTLDLGNVDMPQKFHSTQLIDLFRRYFDYLFYIDFEASMAEPRAQYALGHLQVSIV